MRIIKVIASEDWKGMREDFRMASDLVTFKGWSITIHRHYIIYISLFKI